MDKKENVERRFCTACGKPIPVTANFCPWCGAPQRLLQEEHPSAPPAQPEHALEEQPAVQWAQPSTSPPPPKKKKESGRKKILWLLGIFLVLAAIVATVVGMRFYQREKEYELQMETGLRYLEDGNYQEAILAFNAAIEIKPKSAEAYMGCGDAYMGMGKYKLAAENYLHALELFEQPCKNAELYLSLATAYMELGQRSDAIEILEQGEKATQDERIIQWLEILRKSNGTGALIGMVSEYQIQGGTAPLPGAQVRLYQTIGDTTRLIYRETTSSGGNFSLTGLAEGTYLLHVEADEHIGIETEEMIVAGEENYTELFLLIPETQDVVHNRLDSFAAQVTNAINGEGVANARITLRMGWNNQDGSVAAQANADGEGWFTIPNLRYGYYTAETNADDFTSAYHNVAVLPAEYDIQWSLPMSPILAEGETRIVLTWGEFPYDLDSHLVGENFHVFYADQDFYDSLGRHRVNLDLDDTSSYGPETITIYQSVDDFYTYSVYDYSNGDSSNSTALSTSGATVRVYQAEGLTATYHVPAGIIGTTWAVFRILENGSIETINTVSNVYPSR